MHHKPPCAFTYQADRAYCVCACRQFAIVSCPSRERAATIWTERHMSSQEGESHVH